MTAGRLERLRRFVLANEGSVKARIVRSGIWVGIASATGSILGLVRSIILARLLTPEMFGLMGLAGVAIRAIETFTRPGVVQALIARPRAFDEAAETAFTLLVARGVLLAILLTVAAPWVAVFYESDQLEPVLQALAAVFVLGGFANINMVARQKELEFRQLTYLGLTTGILGTVITITLAFWLRNVWALVIGQVASVGTNVVLSYGYVSGWPRFAWNQEIAAELLRYGRFITGSSIVLFIALEIDAAVIGKVLGVEQVGFYALAFTVANLATTNVSKVASSIMMPAYSKLQSDLPALRRAYLRTLSLVMLLVLPVSVGLILVAEPLVREVYGEKWLPVVLPLQVLAVFGMFRALASFSGFLFEGIGIPKVAFHLGLLRLALIVPLIVPMVVYFGPVGAAITVTVGIAIQWTVGLVHLKNKLCIGPVEIMRCILRSAWTTTVMGFAVLLTMETLGSNSIVRLATIVAGGIALYALLNWPVITALRRERW